jgi:hypothetical protein
MGNPANRSLRRAKIANKKAYKSGNYGGNNNVTFRQIRKESKRYMDDDMKYHQQKRWSAS